jgi:hypothetical protein
MSDNLDYNLAYYGLTQARANQLAEDQNRFIFVEFAYENDLVKNIYLQKDNKQTIVFKVEINANNINGNIFLVKKSFYPEALYDYITLTLDQEFYDFYLENQFNPKYRDMDLRAVWYFVMLDRTIEFNIKKVRETKYIFSYKKLCQAFDYPDKDHSDIKVTCNKLGLLKKGETYLCPKHFPTYQ